MIKELASVVKVEQHFITVTSQIKSSCSGCSQLDNCGSGQIAKALPKPKLTLTLAYEGSFQGKQLKEGDCVIIGLPEENILNSAAQVYLLPLAGLLTFSAIGQWLYNIDVLSHELMALVFGGGGGYLGYRVAKLCQGRGENQQALSPKIIELLPEKSIQVS